MEFARNGNPIIGIIKRKYHFALTSFFFQASTIPISANKIINIPAPTMIRKLQNAVLTGG
ncbi:hypothetical protein NT05LM_3170, partial [Listeria marthii FSL S4-120]